MKSGIPIIFFHKGDSYYLQYTFNQVLESNPNSEIYLIGDESNKYYENLGIHHVDFITCESTAKEFEKLYIHLSSMGGFVERICFQRWMYIRDFVRNKGLEGKFCCLDSDVLVYGDITEYCSKYCADADVTFHGKYGPGCNVFKDVSILSLLIDKTFEYYTTPSLTDKLKHIYHDCHKNVTDMTMLEAFVDECNVKTFDLLEIIDGVTFDSHIAKATDQRFEMDGIFKKTLVRGKNVYCVEKSSGKQIMMMLLHIQGFYKMYMFRWYTGDKKKVEPKAIAFFRLVKLTFRQRLYRVAKKVGLKKHD